MTQRRPKAPDHLKPATAAWWLSVTADYMLEPHHERLLTLAATAWDRAEEARAALAKHGLTFTDRFAAPHARPEIAIERDSRTGFARLLRELGFDGAGYSLWLDENLEHASTLPWKAFFKGKSFPKERYLHHLVKVVLNIAEKGGVIVGRGAHLILGPDRAFRVRIIGSLEACAQRVAERDQLDIEAARELVVTVNRQRADYLEQLYGEGIDDCSDYDIVLNTDRFDEEQAVALILHSMQQAGYDIPAERMQAV